MTRTIRIDPVTRIEGHARVLLDVGDDDRIVDARLVVNELRGFERILVGMQAERMPQVTARICGVCPTAHHLAAVKALEAASGVTPPPAAVLARELMLVAHFIHSHTLSLFVLAGPDLVFGVDAPAARRSIVAMIEEQPQLAKAALRLRTLGQKITEAIGGRGVHPVTAVAGGMAARLTEAQRKEIEAWVDEAMTLAPDLVAKASELARSLDQRTPKLGTALTLPELSMGTVSDGKLSLYDGRLRVADARGTTVADIAPGDYADLLVERAASWSYMKPTYVAVGATERPYCVGTLARLNVAKTAGTPLADAALAGFRKVHGATCQGTTKQLEARAIELLYAVERAKALISAPALLGEPHVPAGKLRGRGVGHVEAPRGTLIHDYEIDERGIVRRANLIVATQQNHVAINQAIRQAAELFGVSQDEKLLNGVELAIRCFDPCLSCATHALGQMPLELVVRRGADVIRTVRRL